MTTATLERTEGMALLNKAIATIKNDIEEAGGIFNIQQQVSLRHKSLHFGEFTDKMTTSDFLKFVGPSGQKITRTGNTAKYAGPGVRQKCLFVYSVLHRKSEMQLVCWNDHGQLGIRICFK